MGIGPAIWAECPLPLEECPLIPLEVNEAEEPKEPKFFVGGNRAPAEPDPVENEDEVPKLAKFFVGGSRGPAGGP